MKNYFLRIFFLMTFSTYCYGQNQNETIEKFAEEWCNMLEKELDSVDIFPDLEIAVRKTDRLFFQSIIGDQLDELAKSIVDNDKEQDDPYNFAVNLLMADQEKNVPFLICTGIQKNWLFLLFLKFRIQPVCAL